MLTKIAHGSRDETVACPDARLAFSSARRIEGLEEVQEQSVQDHPAIDRRFVL